MSILSKPYFHDEEAAYAKVESIVWRRGPVCPHCGNADEARVYALKGKSHRAGLRKCAECRKQFTVKIGTIFESSHIPLHKWLQAIYLMASSKKGISSNQLARTLEVTVKTAWFMSHRIREGAFDVMGGSGGIVEVDETFIGHDTTIRPRHDKKGRGYAHKFKVLALVDRATGKARDMVVDDLKAKTLVPILQENIDRETRVMTDEAGQYFHLHEQFPEHGFVRHGAGEHVSRLDSTIHTNTIEGFFSIFKRGMKGVYQHCSKKHLHRYLAEFDSRYNSRNVSDVSRAETALSGIVRKRLTYLDSSLAK